MIGPMHTPGPWIYDAESGQIQAHNGCIAETVDSDYTPTQDDHNGRLIAAAPDMLTALHLVGMSAGWQYMAFETRDIIEAAIAKAEGRA